MTYIYNLSTINSIINEGFNYKIPESTLNLIKELAIQVGSPDYIKTPIFEKKEKKFDSLDKLKFKKKQKLNEINNDEEWNNLRANSISKLNSNNNIYEENILDNNQSKKSIITKLRSLLNKLTDKNYETIREQLFNELLIINQDDLPELSEILFSIASSNKYYSKIYADLYSDLINEFPLFKSTITENLQKFNQLFEVIEYVDPSKDYDKFCLINKSNEKRKALVLFYVNLMRNNVISKNIIIDLTYNLLEKVYDYIQEDNKKNEVDELTENIALLYSKSYYDDFDEDDDEYLICGYSIPELIKKLASSNIKDYSSLTNKSLFKFMDMVEELYS